MPDKKLNNDQADFLELSRELLDRGGRLRFQAHGQSMHPFINNGDIIVVEPRNGHAVSTGDIIFYRRPDDSLIAHRLIKIHREQDMTALITKGDAVNLTDQPIARQQVMGRVITIEGKGRKLKLDGWTGRIISRLIAWTARGRYPSQRRLVRYIDRFGWLLLGKQTK
jgi:signal peptidase I